MEIIRNMLDYIRRFPEVGSVWDIIDVLLVAVVIYYLVQFFRKTNALSALYAVVLLIIVMAGARFFKLYTLNFILESLIQVGVIAIVVLFQPELRRALEQMGAPRITALFSKNTVLNMDSVILQTVSACKALALDKVGALIVFERHVRLGDIVKTGTILDASVTDELLKNIFYPKAPLHDGAVIVSAERIAGAGCMLPLTNNKNISSDLGMRHRAGIGMSENSDAVVVIVSEESGAISVAVDGMLKRHLAPETLEKLLVQTLIPQAEDSKQKGRGRGKYNGK